MIQPKPKPTMRNLTVSLPEDELATLDEYCRFLGGATDRTYVIAEALRQVIGRDKRFRNGGRGEVSISFWSAISRREASPSDHLVTFASNTRSTISPRQRVVLGLARVTGRN